ncbi:MAG TPA: hypothetical protein VN461_02715 [Vicinamibacteria bacterium]|jgi:hypothetical protein|nr:hypothetical protein [Vicinamibacteria bacterium]
MTPAGVLVCLATLLPPGCRARPEARTVEETILDRRSEGLEALTEGARKNSGRLLAPEDILIVVGQGLVQQVLDGAVPFERTIGNRFRVRVAHCTVHLEDGLALVQLEGRASLAGGEEVGAELTVYGGLDVVDLDPQSGVLRAGVHVFAVEAKRGGLLGLPTPTERLAEEIGREKLESFSLLLSSVEIPVRLERAVTLPAIGTESGVSIAAAHLPLNLSVVEVLSFQRRLWVTIRASPTGPPGTR